MKKKKLKTNLIYRVLPVFLAIIFVIPVSGFVLATDGAMVTQDYLIWEVDESLEVAEATAILEELLERVAQLKRTIVAVSPDRVPEGIYWVTQATMDTFNLVVAPFMPSVVAASFAELWIEPNEETTDYFVPDPGNGPQVINQREQYVETAYPETVYKENFEYEQAVFSGDANSATIATLVAAIDIFKNARQIGTLAASEAFIRNVELFPELWCSLTLRTGPAFQFTGNNTHQLLGTTWTRRDAGAEVPLTIWDNDFNIVEEVFIELPIDTDGDGKRDFIRATIRRPIESERYAELTIPAFLESSPYREGTLGLTVVDVTRPLSEGTPTSHFTFADVESIIPRAADWPWDRDEAIYWNGNAWISGVQPDTIDITVIPPARPSSANVVSRGNPVPVTGAAGGGHVNHNGNFAAYMFARGYAIITTNTVGNVFADGFTSTGGICETLSAIAAIQWLNGNARGFTCQEAIYEVDPTTWSNGMVAMSGTSYNGTLPIAAAATGVDGLGLIIPIAAISNWYYYHRGNGAVVYPGRNNAWHAGFPGEEASDLALLCFTRRRIDGAALNAIERGIPSYLRFHADNTIGDLLRANADLHWQRMIDDEDFASGDYNRFWDDRNYLATADRITAGIIMQHALNDFNVMPRHFDVLHRAVTEKSSAEMRIVLNRSGHTSFHFHDALFDWQHLWFDHFLFGIDNDALDMPMVQIQSSVTGRYESFDQWPIPDSVVRRYFLAPPAENSQTAAGSLSFGVPQAQEFTITDAMNHWTASWNSTGVPPASAQNVPTPFLERTAGAGDQTGGRPALLSNWESALFDVHNLDAKSGERLVFVTEITENVRMNGTIVASIEASSDVPWGNLSAALVEIRPAERGRVFGTGAAGAAAGVNTEVVRTIAAHNGVPAISVVTPTAPVTPSGNNFWIDYKKVTSGTVDIQNPNQTDIVSYRDFPGTVPHGLSRGRTYMEAGHQNFIPNYYFQTINPTPGEFYTYVFTFEAMDWEFMAGDKLAIMVFTQDYRYSLTPENPPTVTIRTGENTFVDIPSIQPLNAQAEGVVFNGSNPNVLRALLENQDVILQTSGNLGIFAHHSPFVIPAGRTLTVVNALNVQGNAELIIEGRLVVQDDGRVNNQGGAGGTIQIAAGGELINNGHVENVTNSTVINRGRIINNNRFEIRAGTTFDNTGTLIGNLNIHRNAIRVGA